MTDVIDYMTRNEADMAFKRRVRTIFDWIDPQPDDMILDIPCGRGFYLNMIRYVSGCTLVGADLDWDVIQKARGNVGDLPAVSLHHASIYQLPYPSDTFDAVILSEVLEHIDDDVAGLREVWRVLKPGGVVAITVPNADYPFAWDPINWTLERYFNRRIQQGLLAGIWANHVRLYTRDQLYLAALDAGFDIDAERAFTHYSFPFIHNLVYGLGKTLLEGGLLPDGVATTADRTQFDQPDGHPLNPVRLGLRVFNWIDRWNVMDEPAGRSTVNLCLKGRKPR
jgi:SAM-dependent methyltransferase